MSKYLFGREDEEDVTFDDLEENLGAKELEDQDFTDYDTMDVSGGKNHADEKEVVEAELAMDPAEATESYIGQMFGLSREDIDEAADEVVEASETAADEEAGYGDDDPDVSIDNDGDDTSVGVDLTGDGEDDVTLTIDNEVGCDSCGEEEETATDIAATEHLRRAVMYGLEDTDDAENDVNLSVEVPGESDYDIGIDGKAVTLEPGDGGDDDMGGDDDFGGDDEGDDDMGEESTEEPTEDEGDEGDEEASGESINWDMF